LTAQILVAAHVLIGGRMLSAVRFDDQLRFETSKIDDVRRDRVLSAKTPPELFAAQPVP
jgi:hypothetical protein